MGLGHGEYFMKWQTWECNIIIKQIPKLGFIVQGCWDNLRILLAVIQQDKLQTETQRFLFDGQLEDVY